MIWQEGKGWWYQVSREKHGPFTTREKARNAYAIKSLKKEANKLRGKKNER